MAAKKATKKVRKGRPVKVPKLAPVVEKKPFAASFPKLHALVSEGDVFKDDGEYVGHAADGQEVSLGSVGSEAQVEAYLAKHPGPKSW